MADRFIRFILCKKHMLFLEPRFAIAVAVVQRAFKTAMITSTLLYYVTYDPYIAHWLTLWVSSANRRYQYERIQYPLHTLNFLFFQRALSCYPRETEKVAFEVPNEKECQHLHCEPISPNSPRRAQVTGRFERQIFARLSYSRKYRIDLCSHIKPIAYLIVGCMALGYVSAQTIWNARPVVAAIF